MYYLPKANFTIRNISHELYSYITGFCIELNTARVHRTDLAKLQRLTATARNFMTDELDGIKNYSKLDDEASALEKAINWTNSSSFISHRVAVNPDSECFIVESNSVYDELVEEGKRLYTMMESFESLRGSMGIIHAKSEIDRDIGDGVAYIFARDGIVLSLSKNSKYTFSFASETADMMPIHFFILAVCVLQNFSTDAKPVDGVWRDKPKHANLPDPVRVIGLQREVKKRRKWHFRQLRSECYYRGEWANSLRGSRWIICGLDSSHDGLDTRDLTTPKTVLSASDTNSKVSMLSNSYKGI